MIEIIGKNGAGKSFLANQLYYSGFLRNVSYTTRSMRRDEINGLDYHFITEEKFLNMIKEGLFVEYKVVNGVYYGISKNNLKENTILVSGDSKEIEAKTGFKIFNIYVDSDISVRYERVRKRENTNCEVFYRFHGENYSFLDDFSAFFVNNDFNNSAVLEVVLSKINYNGSILDEYLSSSREFLQKKVDGFRFDRLDSCDDQMLKFLQFEEYLIRRLVLEQNLINLDFMRARKLYYEVMKEFMKYYNIDYRYVDDNCMIKLNDEEYDLDFKLKKKVR